MLFTLNHYFSLSKNVTTAGNFATNLLAKYRGNIVASNSFEQQCCLVYDGLKKNPKWQFFTSRGATPKLHYYVIHSFYWKSAVEHDGGV